MAPTGVYERKPSAESFPFCPQGWVGERGAEQTGRSRAQNMYPGEIYCSECGKKAERHHIDENTLNNDPSNIEFLCRKHHKARHRKPNPSTSEQRRNQSAAAKRWWANATPEQKAARIAATLKKGKT